MLHIRQARAHAKAGARPAAIRSINAAFDAWSRGTRADDPAYLYWVNEAELLNLAGSSALDLGDAPQALAYFRKVLNAGGYDDGGYPRVQHLSTTRARLMPISPWGRSTTLARDVKSGPTCTRAMAPPPRSGTL
jgi:hypothetical protein